MRLEPWFCLFLAIVSLGCARVGSGPSAISVASSTPDVAPECPVPDAEFEISSCDASKSRGLQADQPLEWGPFAFRHGQRGNPLFGRMICDDGTQAVATLIDHAPLEGSSASAPSLVVPRKTGAPADLVDRYEVRCGQGPAKTLFVNPYRCGEVCPPTGFQFTSLEVAKHLNAALVHFNGGEREGAIEEARRALNVQPKLETAYELLFLATLQLGRLEEALDVIEKGVNELPNSFWLAHIRIVALGRLERYVEEAEAVSELIPRLEAAGNDALLGQVLLQGALAARKAGKLEESNAMEARACELTNYSHPVCTLLRGASNE